MAVETEVKKELVTCPVCGFEAAESSLHELTFGRGEDWETETEQRFWCPACETIDA